MDEVVRMLEYRDWFALYKQSRSNLIRDSDSGSAPLVSIMIPTFRRPALLREAVQSALSQTTAVPFEVVVVDNDNDPVTVTAVNEVIASFSANNLRLFRNQENIGMFGNWNRCIELARGRWLTILNDDDLLDHQYLTESLEVVKSDKTISLVGCKVRLIDERNACTQKHVKLNLRNILKELRDNIAPQKPRELMLADYFFSYKHCGSLGIMMDRKAAQLVGGYSPDCYPCSDYVFLARYVRANKVFFTPKVLATYRILVNESIKPELIVAWTRKILQLREEIIPLLAANPMLLRYYSRLSAINFARGYSKTYKVKLNLGKLLKKEGLINRPTYYEAKLAEWLIRFILHWKKEK